MAETVVDTNILIRLITGDVPEQANQVKSILSTAPTASIELPLYVLSEAAYVLSFNPIYRLPRAQIAASFDTIIYLDAFELDRPLAGQAINLFRSSKFDFVDCLLLAQKQLYNQTVLTFDKPLQKQLAKS